MSTYKRIRFLKNIEALRKLQFNIAKLDGKLAEQILVLEKEYEHKIEPLQEIRKKIVIGEYEPCEEDIDVSLTYVDIPEAEEEPNLIITGIPKFWLTVLNNTPIFWKMIHPQDLEPLSFLTDIKCSRNTEKSPGFTILFYFSPNKYFLNEVLEKRYIIAVGQKEGDIFNLVGAEFVECIGCQINWKNKKDLTYKNVKGKLKKRQSFFNFFDPPRKTSDPHVEEYVNNCLLEDFNLGFYLKEKIIPNAVMYYLGEAVLRENFIYDLTVMEEEEITRAEEQKNDEMRINQNQELLVPNIIKEYKEKLDKNTSNKKGTNAKHMNKTNKGFEKDIINEKNVMTELRETNKIPFISRRGGIKVKQAEAIKVTGQMNELLAPQIQNQCKSPVQVNEKRKLPKRIATLRDKNLLITM